MKKIVLLLMIFTLAFSQKQRCGTDEYHELLLQKYPELKKIEQRAKEKIHNFNPNSMRTNQIITIPVVVHILYENPSENLPDSQVISQIEVLNEDYRALNKDISKVPSYFNNVVADYQIEFCLATKDPNGNPTTGITRTPTTVTEFSKSDDAAKKSSLGGKDPWPTDKYLNIWVCDLQSGLLGYATFPSTAVVDPSIDGVVIDYLAFGRNGTANPPYHLGRTATHEIGHWLGLYHTFQGGCEGTSNLDCDSKGDEVCDTPPTAQSNYGCPQPQNTCIETPNDLNDMTMNYMDYGDDACIYMFTKGQKARSYAMISQYRQWLLNGTPSCALPPLIANFYTKTKTICEGSSITFYDNSQGNPTDWLWIFPGATPDTMTVQNPTVSYASAGTYDVTLIITRGNEKDTIIINDYITVIKESDLTGEKLPFTEDFESRSFTTNSWEIFNPDSNITWQIIPVKGTSPGGYAAYMNLYNYKKKGEKDAIISPVLDFRNLSSAFLTFEHSYAKYSNTSNETDSLIIYVVDGCTGKDSVIAQIGETGNGELATAKPSTKEYFPQTEKDWCKFSTISQGCYAIDLSAFLGKLVRIKFETSCQYENNMFIDNINIEGVYTSILTSNNIKLKIYPNPTKGKLNLLTNQELTVYLYSISGKLLRTYSLRGNKQIDLSDLPKGSYILKAVYKDYSVNDLIIKY